MNSFAIFQGESIIVILLLFFRITSLLSFLPIFGNMVIPMNVKALLGIYLTAIFLPSIEIGYIPDSWLSLFLAIFSEIIFGATVGLLLNIPIYILIYAGEHVSMVMGFSMATLFDPQTQITMSIISQFFNFFAILLIFAFDGHHMMIQCISHSFENIKLGGFFLTEDIFKYIISSFKNLFVMGLTLAFPIVALSLLSDIIFGMLMKTMPQFNLLVIGYPIKIGVGLVVMMAVMGGLAFLFKGEFKKMCEIIVLF